MQGNFFMQLILVIAALMLLGGKGGAPNRLNGSDIADVIKYISGGNGEVDKLIKDVEQVTEIINAFAPIVGAVGGMAPSEAVADATPDKSDIGIRLKPIAGIADDNIYNALSRAIG